MDVEVRESPLERVMVVCYSGLLGSVQPLSSNFNVNTDLYLRVLPTLPSTHATHPPTSSYLILPLSPLITYLSPARIIS